MAMKLSEEILGIISGADQRALATVGEDGPNVVPLSMTIIDGDRIVICDCFMDKSAKNLAKDNRAAVSFWKGFVGVQVKGLVSYKTEGEYFERYTDWLKEKYPDRTLRGVLVLTAERVYDLHPQNAGVELARG